MSDQTPAPTLISLDSSTSLSALVVRLDRMTNVEERVDQLRVHFANTLATDPVYAMESYGEAILRVGHLHRILAPLTKFLQAATEETFSAERIRQWMERTVEQIEDDLLSTSPSYRHNSTSYISNLSSTEKAMAMAEARRILKDALGRLQEWEASSAAAD